jgi:hypothetical protein
MKQRSFTVDVYVQNIGTARKGRRKKERTKEETKKAREKF